jgi:transposase
MTSDMTETIGCDLGDKVSTLCTLSAEGTVTSRSEVKTERPSVERWLRGTPRAHLVMEVGTHSPWISGLAMNAGHRVTVVNPHAFKLITQSRRKSDKDDAEMLARAARADLELVRPVTHRQEATRVEMAVLRTRDLLVRERTRLVGHVRGTLKGFGVRAGTCAAERFHVRVKDFIPAELKEVLGVVLDQLEHLHTAIGKADASIEKLSKAHPEAKVLTSVPRVGPLTAILFTLAMEDPKRFKRSRDVGAYFGLTPGRRQSGDSDVALGITKEGDALVRRMLVQCAHQVMLKRAPDSALKRWAVAKVQTIGKKKTAIALARKLAVVLHRLLVTGKPYQPFPEGDAH